MSLTKETKQKIVKQFAKKEGDTGCPEVQVALLTHSIKHLTEHLKNNKNDIHSRTGLMKQVGQRRRLLNYLNRIDSTRYQSLIEALDLRK